MNNIIYFRCAAGWFTIFKGSILITDFKLEQQHKQKGMKFNNVYV